MKQRSNLLMKVLLCKIQCSSLFSLCKPSKASHLYTSAPLKLENNQNGPNPSSVLVVSVVDVDDGCEKVDGSNSDFDEGDYDNALKSCIKRKLCNKSGDCGGDVKDKKKVQWVDSFGKELVEIKEFESRSCIKNKVCGESGGGVQDKKEKKKKVQWIKELESSETGDPDELENRTCSCLIL